MRSRISAGPHHLARRKQKRLWHRRSSKSELCEVSSGQMGDAPLRPWARLSAPPPPPLFDPTPFRRRLRRLTLAQLMGRFRTALVQIDPNLAEITPMWPTPWQICRASD